jgi:uncharacterized protein YcfJ
MKKLVFAVASALALAAPATFAQSHERDYYRDNYRADRYDDRRDRRDDFARVIESRPVYDTANAKSECINTRTGAYEEVREENRHRIGKGAAIGAVAGGVLGHQVDHGGGTAAGAVLGGLLGHYIEGRRDNDDQADLDMGRCRTLADNGNLQGYDVRYEYRGQEYVTRMDHEPGRRLRVGDDINYDGSPRDGQVASYSTPSYR